MCGTPSITICVKSLNGDVGKHHEWKEVILIIPYSYGVLAHLCVTPPNIIRKSIMHDCAIIDTSTPLASRIHPSPWAAMRVLAERPYKTIERCLFTAATYLMWCKTS